MTNPSSRTEDELRTAFENFTGMRVEDWPEEFREFKAFVRQRELAARIDELEKTGANFSTLNKAWRYVQNRLAQYRSTGEGE